MHIHNNAATLRNKLVSHEGKMALSIATDQILPGSPENAWEDVIAKFSAQIQENIGVNYSALVTDFSTTGPVERNACEVALMEAFEPYFEYHVYCICGIPEITLLGTPEDWIRLGKRLMRWNHSIWIGGFPICGFLKANQIYFHKYESTLNGMLVVAKLPDGFLIGWDIYQGAICRGIGTREDESIPIASSFDEFIDRLIRTRGELAF